MDNPWWLVIEDDEVDVMTIERGLSELGQAIGLSVVPNGFQPLAHLRACQSERGGTQPRLIMVDINLPLASGHEVLRQLKEDPEARKIPTVVLTTSDQDTDVSEAYASGASGYFLKSPEFGRFVKTLGSIVDYWAVALEAR